MLYREIIAVFSEIHTKHINALWAEHRISEFLKLVVPKLSLRLQKLVQSNNTSRLGSA